MDYTVFKFLRRENDWGIPPVTPELSMYLSTQTWLTNYQYNETVQRKVKVGSPQLSITKAESKIETRHKSQDEGTQSQISILDSCINKLPIK